MPSDQPTFSASTRSAQVDRTYTHDLRTQTYAQAYARWMTCCAAILFGFTWPLWLPQDRFPQVPLLGDLGWWALEWWGSEADRWAPLQYAAIILMAIGLTLPLLRRPSFWYCYPAGLLLAVAFDLHRLQPWAYQFALLALVFAVGPWAGSTRWLRAFVISIYLYSAVGKFDAQFLHTVGPQLLQAAAKFIGIDAAGDPAGVVSSVWVRGSLIFPITELIAALLLACPPQRLPHARTAGRWLATAMHLTLIVLLGPLGLGHRWGVLAWNLFFIGQAWILFRDDRPEDATDASADSTSDHNHSPAPPVRAWIARAAIVVAMVWPLTERWGYCDHWLAWALYSPHSSRAELLILPQAQDRLPTELQELLVPAADVDSLGEWLRLPLDQWSLRDLQAPIYPQARFQADVARQTVQRYGLDGVCRLRVWSAAERWSGRRDLVYDGPP